MDANEKQNLIPTANVLPPKQYHTTEEFIEKVERGMKDENVRNFEKVAHLLANLSGRSGVRRAPKNTLAKKLAK